VTLQSLVSYSYGMRGFRIIGGPSWMSSSRWEVSAKADRVPTAAEMRGLVRRMLEERFALRTHTETRDMPIYELVLDRQDGRLGPSMTPAAFDCEPFLSGLRPARESPIDPVTGFRRCGTAASPGGGAITVRLNGYSLPRLATFLEPDVERVVLDKTGVTGVFDMVVTYEDGRNQIPGSQPKEAPALFTALQEQLGMRLRSARGPVEVLVIDRAEQPTSD